MEEKKRKSSRSFELEKGSKRSFDLQKTSARKFDLKKDSDEVSLEELKKDLLADGKIDAEEVNKLREVLFADGKIDQEEADFLFEINDAVSGKPNDSSWKAFFVEAISDYLLNDEKSPGVIDEKEGKWLEAKINNDGKLDTVERALVASLRHKSKSMPKSLSAVLSKVASRFNLKKDEVPAAEAAAAEAALAATKAKASRFSLEKEINDSATINMEQLKKEILDDGKIDRKEVEILRKNLYADGRIDQKEADFLFELNNAVSGNNKDSSWDQFFVQAISDYLLKDERSPGVIDEDEGRWLVEKIGADGKVDGVEKQLLNNLKKNAKKMPPVVTALLNGDAKTPDSTSANIEEPKSRKLLWILLAVVVAAIIGYFCMKSCDGNKKDQSTEQVASGLTSENARQVTPKDSTTDKANGKESSVADDGGEDKAGSQASEVGGSSIESAKTQSEETAAAQKSSKVPNGSDNNQITPKNKPSASSNQQTAPVRPASPTKSAISTKPVSINSQQLVPIGSVEETARKVIRGIYGNGIERKRNLGDRYAEIQSIVNEMYRKGLVR